VLTKWWNRQSVDKRTIIENYDLVSLAIDEIVDELKGIDLSEQGMNNLAQFGKAKLGDWLRQGL
jgi:hypothetical protein